MTAQFKPDDLQVDFKLQVGTKQCLENSLGYEECYRKLAALIVEWTESSHLSDDDKLKVEPFPNPYTLAQFAKVVYPKCFNCKRLPDGWQLLTSAENTEQANRYFGAAYFHSRHGQIVVAHRGTKGITDINGWINNYYSMVRGECYHQVSSAVTFVDLICKAVSASGISVQLSITGHSLGGWLAQITTLTAEYLTVAKERFTRADGHHAHALVFDSPGCKSMLKMILEAENDTFEPRRDSSMNLNDLDIITYLSAPNLVNMRNLHAGTVFTIFIDDSEKGIPDKSTLHYHLYMQDMDRILKMFDPKIGEIKKGNNNESLLKEVLDWPKESDSNFPKRSKQYQNISNEAKHSNKSNLDSNFKHSFVWKEVTPNKRKISVFTKKELNFVRNWKDLIKNSKQRRFERLEQFVRKYHLGEYQKILEGLLIEKEMMECDSMHEMIKHTRTLVRWFFDEVNQVVQLEMADVHSDVLFGTESDIYKKYLASLITADTRFFDWLGLTKYINNMQEGILILRSEDTEFEIMRISNIVEQMGANKAVFLSWQYLLRIEQVTNLERMFRSLSEDLLIIEQSQADDGLVAKILNYFNGSCSKKLIFVTSQAEMKSHFQKLSKVPIEEKVWPPLQICDLMPDSQHSILKEKLIKFKDKKICLEEVINENDRLNLIFDSHQLKLLISINYNEIELKSTTSEEVYFDVFFREICEKVDLIKLLTQDMSDLSRIAGKPVVFVINGIVKTKEELFRVLNIDDEIVKNAINKNLISERIFLNSCFREVCKEYPESRIYDLDVGLEQSNCRCVYDASFYVRRKFLIPTIRKDVRNLIKEEKDLFVFSGVESIEELMRILRVHEKDRVSFSALTNIYFSLDEEEIKQDGRPVHWIRQKENRKLIWQRSRGPVKELKKYLHKADKVDEVDFIKEDYQVAVITDGPGMGKTTSLTSLSNQLDSSWMFKIKLKNYSEPMTNLPEEPGMSDVVTFLMGNSSNLNSGLLLYCLQHKTDLSIHILLDGFDEIQEAGLRKKMIKLLKFLKERTKAKVWVTTRENCRQQLEEGLSVISVRFKKIEEFEQKDFLNRVWSSHACAMLGEFKESHKSQLESYVEKVFNKARILLGEEILQVMGIPLQMTMLAEVLTPNAKIFSESEKLDDVKLNIESATDLYQKFIEKKLDISFHKKHMKRSETERKRWRNYFVKLHGKEALKFLFPKPTESQKWEIEKEDKEDLNRMGLMRVDEDGHVDFFHRTYAEFFVAEFVYRWMAKQNKNYMTYPFLQKLLLLILTKVDWKVIRIFLNDMLVESKLSSESAEFHRTCIARFFNSDSFRHWRMYKHTFLILALTEKHEGIFDLVFKNNSKPEELVHLVAAFNCNSDTVLSYAFLWSPFGVPETFLKRLVEYLNVCPNDACQEIIWLSFFIKNHPFKQVLEALKNNGANGQVVAMYNGMIPLYDKSQLIMSALRTGEPYMAIDYLKEAKSWKFHEILMKWTYDPNHKCFLVHEAASLGYQEIIKYLLKQKINSSIYGPFVNLEDIYGRTALTWAVDSNRISICRLLLNHGADVNHNGELLKETLLHRAVSHGNLELCEILIKKGASINSANMFGQTPLSIATAKNLSDICELMKEQGTVRK